MKQWRRDAPTVDTALREIWRQEIRHLHRIAGCPGARDTIVPLLDSGQTEDSFYLILATGQRVPLKTFMSDALDHHPFKGFRDSRNRILIWRNLKRIAAGLDVLHSQGVIHRNLDRLSIFTAGDTEPDFLLSGFEWSVRISSVAKGTAASNFGRHSESFAFSFLEDWRQFGFLAKDLVAPEWDVEASKSGGRDGGLHLLSSERDLIRFLLRAEPTSRLDGQFVHQRIDDVVSALSTANAGAGGTLHITFSLSHTSDLRRAVSAAGGDSIDPSDPDSLLEFITRDVSEHPKLALVSIGSEAAPRYLLLGRSLAYRLKPFRPKNAANSTWAVAYCESTNQPPLENQILAITDLSRYRLEAHPMNSMASRFASIQGRGAFWDSLVTLPSDATDSNDAARQYRAIALLQVLETLLAAAAVFPVAVVTRETTGAQIRVSLIVRADEAREALAEALLLADPKVRLDELLVDESIPVEDDWKLTDVGILGERDDRAAGWRYMGSRQDEKLGIVYEFEGVGPLPDTSDLYLRASDHVGIDRLLRRRTRALRALENHVELLEMLAQPRMGVRATHESVADDSELASLDESKQQALRELYSVLPLYLIQGPPGVGKTRIITELVRRSLLEDSTTRLLLTAQSHHAVDHLLEQVEKTLSENIEDGLLLVRSTRRQDADGLHSYDLREQSRAVLFDFAASELVAESPEFFQAKIRSLIERYRASSEDESNPLTPAYPDRTLEALMLRSANVVFATTNAADIERLIDERAQFDWSVIEEAGKATGVELISPLLLSYRRVMIGDHQQLPPFNTERLVNLLADPKRIGNVIQISKSLVNRSLRESVLDDLVLDLSDLEEITSTCGLAARSLTLFKSIFEPEYERMSIRAPRWPIAKRLNFQHRMHPAIARLVSECFYEGSLKTDDECARRFINGRSPVQSRNSEILSLAPITLIDMPFVQTEKNAVTGEKWPRYHNPSEVDAVVAVLRLLEAVPGEKKPSIAILTPYREQVKRMTQAIRSELSNHLAHLEEFSFEDGVKNPVGTVDSFQGSEADVVVLSLVRNNEHADKRGLGFLADPRRMNVLMSRAKWRLVIVGSLDFLRARFMSGPALRGDDLYFLHKMLSEIDSMKNLKDDKGNYLISEIKWKSLTGGGE
ncbi:AAA domain-containing protein [Burkholderia lata]|uniref:AAA domain-containing protein n=1 Tax=Burkholderia lata (strain ATCC 17760 / DSM 23089 / LMG 22485 / NCIMB 9086 / R18194 / 383) TaxID=482957 RepID=UPI001583D2DD|nr:AAA domain-containing protein [Burkholderia lata]